MHIQKLEDDTILLTAPVMIPGAPDCDYLRGEPPLTRAQIRDFKESYEKYQFVDHEHELTRTGKYRGFKRESFLLDNDTTLELYDGSNQTYPAGTWLMTSHITDPEAISAAEKGEYTGYSPSVRSRETADKYLELIMAREYEEAEALKSQSLSGLIKDVPNPVVLSVSLVSKPCQTGSKICKIKNNGESMSNEEQQIKSKILTALGMSDAADVEALKSQVDTLDDKIEELKTDNAEALKSLKEEIVSEFKTALAEFADKSQEEEEEEEEETPEETPDSEEENPNEEENEEEPPQEEADKGSKQGSNHNGANKSQDEMLDTYEFLGRHPDGTRK